jgi:release factor glutamine methyltransferase
MHEAPLSTPITTVGQALRAAVMRLASPEAQTDAELLLAHALGRMRSWLYAHGDQALAPSQADRFESLMLRREAGEPVAYLIGSRGFWAFDLKVTPDTLIPRPETERLVELALARVPATPALRIADLGTGSGAIALALAYERRHAQVIATDVSPAALKVAAANARALGLRNVQLREGSWWAPLKDERFDVIVSNPPYIAEHDPHLRRGDLRYEPARALSSGRDGLDAISILVNGAMAHLRQNGWLLLEHGWDQAEAVRALMTRVGFEQVQSARDLEGHERVSLGRCLTRHSP